MAVLWTILSLFGVIDAIASSLIDYKACQKNFNCTSTLTPDDCPPGKFLDVQITNNCCHGCRVGIGSKTLNLIPSLLHHKKRFFLSVSDSSRSRRKRLQSKKKNARPDSPAMMIFTAFSIAVGACRISIFRLFPCCLPPFTFSLMLPHDAFR